MNDKEAKDRIKINRLLEESGWRFFDDENGIANICLEPNVKLKSIDIDSLGDDFEKTKNGYVDYLLLDEHNNPLIVAIGIFFRHYIGFILNFYHCFEG